MRSTTSEGALRRLFARQRFLMEKVGLPTDGEPYQTPDDLLTDPLLKDVLIMLASEVQEALEPLTLVGKPWKRKRPAEEVAREFMAEVVDCLFLYLELLIVLGVQPDELEARYATKWRWNLENRLGIPSEELTAFEKELNARD